MVLLLPMVWFVLVFAGILEQCVVGCFSLSMVVVLFGGSSFLLLFFVHLEREKYGIFGGMVE